MREGDKGQSTLSPLPAQCPQAWWQEHKNNFNCSTGYANRAHMLLQYSVYTQILKQSRDRQ